MVERPRKSPGRLRGRSGPTSKIIHRGHCSATCPKKSPQVDAGYMRALDRLFRREGGDR